MAQSHPLHPATVHFPITLLFLAYTLDLFKFAPSSTLSVLAKIPVLDQVFAGVSGLNALTIPHYAHHLLTLAILSAIPAILTGIQQLLVMIQRYDLLGKLSKSANKGDVLAKMPDKLKKAFLHAVIMDAVVAVSAYSLYIRRQDKNYELNSTWALLSGPLAILLGFSSALGAELVYDHGVGVHISAKSKDT